MCFFGLPLQIQSLSGLPPPHGIFIFEVVSNKFEDRNIFFGAITPQEKFWPVIMNGPH